jgi:hypothetical protein
MKKLKTKKAALGRIFNRTECPEVTSTEQSPIPMGLRGIVERLAGKKQSATSGDMSLWSPEKMAGLSSPAPMSSGTQTEQQTAKASKGKFIIGKGSDYIKDLL